jgi:hypothetical protein
MGDFKIGDQVFSANGNPTTVLGVFPQGKKEIFKITFSDGTFTECSGDHLWVTQTNRERYARKRVPGKRAEGKYYKCPKKGSVKTTLEILQTLFVEGSKRPNHYIPITEPINFAEKSLPLHPYVLGALLGDGGFSSGRVTFSSADQEIIDRIKILLPENVNINKIPSAKYDYSITDSQSSWVKENRVKTILKQYGLMFKKSKDKFIPDCYKFNSIENRLELLKGLMDTDGTTSEVYSCFTTVSEQLAKDIIFIVQSLGGTARFSKSPSFYTKNNIKVQCQNSYRISIKLPPQFNPFHLSRKANKLKPSEKYFPRRNICNIEKIEEKECQCIYVEDESHTYLTNDCIVTHNTFLSVYCALHMLNMNPKYEIKYIRTIAESGERALGALPGTVDEKFNPFMMPLYDKLDELLPIAQSKYLEDQGYIEALPVNFLRGATWNDKIVIADECFEDSVVLETDKGQKTLKTILKNPSLYKVLSFDENEMKFVFNKVLNTFNKGEQYISEIVLDGRSKIRSTKNHRYLTNHGWKKLEDLKIGDAIISSSKTCNNNFENYSLRTVTDIKLDLYKNNVYDIEVENTHNFVVSTCKSIYGSKVVAHNCQNYSAKELITLLTRIGENTKLFICGDAMQSDIGSKSGFMKIYDVFNNEESEEKGIYCFQFEEEDIMRSEILKYIVRILKKLDKPAAH